MSLNRSNLSNWLSWSQMWWGLNKNIGQIGHIGLIQYVLFVLFVLSISSARYSVEPIAPRPAAVKSAVTGVVPVDELVMLPVIESPAAVKSPVTAGIPPAPALVMGESRV